MNQVEYISTLKLQCIYLLNNLRFLYHDNNNKQSIQMKNFIRATLTANIGMENMLKTFLEVLASC